jgi:hypothetical protein
MSEFWAGLLISIPVGIVVNLLSGPIQRFIGHLSQRAERRRIIRDKTFTEFASTLAADPAKMQAFALETLIRIAYIGAIFGTASGFLWVAAFATGLIGMVAQAVALVGTIMVMNIAGSGIQTLRLARDLLEGSRAEMDA